MSFFKSRSGGSLFRFKALSGYLKILFNRKDSDTGKTEVKNKMYASYKIDGEVK